MADRSISIRLARRKKSESVKRFRFKGAENKAVLIREMLKAWAGRVDLRVARPRCLPGVLPARLHPTHDT